MICFRKILHLYTQTYVCYYNNTPIDREGVKELEEKVHEGMLIADPVNIPIQMVSLTDRDGRMTPLWFRLETKEHEIKKYKIEQVVSRDEKQYVGVREKQYICKISLGEISRTLEMRYSIETQKWRIFQFL